MQEKKSSRAGRGGKEKKKTGYENGRTVTFLGEGLKRVYGNTVTADSQLRSPFVAPLASINAPVSKTNKQTNKKRAHDAVRTLAPRGVSHSCRC